MRTLFKLPESAMLRMLLPLSTLVACTPSPREAAMPSPSPITAAPVESSSETGPEGQTSVASRSTGGATGNPEQAAQAPIQEPVSATDSPAPGLADSPAEARGRRILSTAFVRMGPDGHLTVDLEDGRVLVLRDVVMRPKDYCGTRLLGTKPGIRHCGGYADITAARPGARPT